MKCLTGAATQPVGRLLGGGGRSLGGRGGGSRGGGGATSGVARGAVATSTTRLLVLAGAREARGRSAVAAGLLGADTHHAVVNGGLNGVDLLVVDLAKEQPG